MPRPDKPIRPGRLDDPVSPSRSHSWTKHGGPGGQNGFRAAPSDIEIEVDDITVVQDPDAVPQPTKYDSRASTAHVAYDDYVETPVFEVEKHWTVTRSIDGRIYTRSDAATFVEIRPSVQEGETG